MTPIDVSQEIAFDIPTSTFFEPASGRTLEDQDAARARANEIIGTGGIVVGLNDTEADGAESGEGTDDYWRRRYLSDPCAMSGMLPLDHPCNQGGSSVLPLVGLAVLFYWATK